MTYPANKIAPVKGHASPINSNSNESGFSLVSLLVGISVSTILIFFVGSFVNNSYIAFKEVRETSDVDEIRKIVMLRYFCNQPFAAANCGPPSTGSTEVPLLDKLNNPIFPKNVTLNTYVAFEKYHLKSYCSGIGRFRITIKDPKTGAWSNLSQLDNTCPLPPR